jgi:hypothetical protein
MTQLVWLLLYNYGIQLFPVNTIDGEEHYRYDDKSNRAIFLKLFVSQIHLFS